MNNKEITACFTGHRNLPQIISVKDKLNREIKKRIEQGITYFANGGALGFDTLAALTVLELKETYTHIQLLMVLPCPEQDKYWSEKDKQIYAYLLENADKILYSSPHYHKSCMHLRNRLLIHSANCCIAYLKECTGGTAYTVAYAKKNGVEVVNLAEE